LLIINSSSSISDNGEKTKKGKRERCKNGTRKNAKTGECEKKS
jgi:hypothetical protein